VTFQYSPFTFHATIWQHNGRNMIDWIMDTSKGSEAVWQSVNHTKINSTGIETGIDFAIKALQARIDYGYIHQDKELEEHIVSQYALEYLRHKLTARVDLPLVKRLTLGLNFRWQDRVGQYTDFDGATHDYEPYALLDARLTWQQSQWKVYAEANNLTDKRYRDYGLVEQPGRWLIFGTSITL
jgi:iron complex outermembrane receptor protein